MADLKLDVEIVGHILNNGTDEDVEELTPDDCLRYMAHEMDVPVNELRKKFRKIKEGLPVD